MLAQWCYRECLSWSVTDQYFQLKCPFNSNTATRFVSPVCFLAGACRYTLRYCSVYLFSYWLPSGRTLTHSHSMMLPSVRFAAGYREEPARPCQLNWYPTWLQCDWHLLDVDWNNTKSKPCHIIWPSRYTHSGGQSNAGSQVACFLEDRQCWVVWLIETLPAVTKPWRLSHRHQSPW